MKRIKQSYSNRWQVQTAVVILAAFVASGCGKKPETPDPLMAGITSEQEALEQEALEQEAADVAAPDPVRTRANFPSAQAVEPTPLIYSPLIRSGPRMGR